MFLKNCLCLIILFKLQLTNSQQTKTINYFLNKMNITVKPFSMQTARNGQLITSNADDFRDIFASTKMLFLEQYYKNYKSNYKYNSQTGRLQPQISPDKPFPCDLNNTRSTETPTSVHRLRPGDIDIIGAMGDSITAGNGIMAKIFPHLFIEFRAQTSLGGGLKDWRTFLTLPNILKLYNANLYGYAVANTLAKNRAARFNVAEAIAISQDMPYMAEVLVKRMQMDKKVDMKNHWKMISIFIGANDVCNDMCSYDNVEDFLNKTRQYLHRTLTILKENIPRLMVNLIAIPDIDIALRTMKNIPAFCEALHKSYCHCIIGDTIRGKKLNDTVKAMRRFQQIYSEVASLPEFQLEDFAAVPRMSFVNKTLRTLKNGNTDMRYFAIDCFHFSQRGVAVFTNMLWNEMLQVKSKSLSSLLKPFHIFGCPSEKLPYLSTLKNS